MPKAVTVDELNPSLREVLVRVIVDLGRPVTLSCNRHLGCEAVHRRGVDVRCATADERHRILRAAMKHGIERIGIYPGFIHLDIDNRPRPALWVGHRERPGM